MLMTLKNSQICEKISHVPTSQELLLLKYPYYQNQYAD
jgi:hypothetical protein